MYTEIVVEGLCKLVFGTLRARDDKNANGGSRWETVILVDRGV